MKDRNVVWDIPTRITHWVLAVCVVLNLFILEEGDDPHQILGYLAVAAVVFRFGWRYYKFKGPSPNRIAAIAYAIFWFLILGLGLTGFLMGTDRFWGEQWLEDIHVNLSLAMQAFIVIHLLGLTIDSISRKRHTWLGMFNGRRDF